jgi:uncharacterized protein
VLIDANLRCSGHETTGTVLQTLDDAGIDVAVLRAPFLDDGGGAIADPGRWRAANAHVAKLVRGAGDRLVGLAFIDPSLPDAPQELRRTVDAGLAGAQMVPHGWYPHEERVQPAFEEAAALEMPLLFPSGLVIDGVSGRYGRPLLLEPLRAHRGLRVALTHLGWPWTDEALALGVVDRAQGLQDARAAFRLDLAFAAPSSCQPSLLQRALQVLGPGLLQFGSDCMLPCPGARIAERHACLTALLDRVGLSAAERNRIFARTAAAWLGRGAGTPSATACTPRTATLPKVELDAGHDAARDAAEPAPPDLREMAVQGH